MSRIQENILNTLFRPKNQNETLASRSCGFTTRQKCSRHGDSCGAIRYPRTQCYDACCTSPKYRLWENWPYLSPSSLLKWLIMRQAIIHKLKRHPWYWSLTLCCWHPLVYSVFSNKSRNDWETFHSAINKYTSSFILSQLIQNETILQSPQFIF